MTNHYYSQNPEVGSDPQHFTFDLRGRSFRFKTDHGVFSKKEVDFGSRVLIDAFELPGVDGPVLDVGCGYGPIGLSLAKEFPERTIHMIDVNERALSLASENAAANGVGNVEIYQSDRFEQVEEKKFSAILTNPPIRAGKETVHAIFTESAEHLAENGELWVVIQKKQGAPSAMEKMEELFSNVEVVVKKKGYYILKSVKEIR
ncbi:class I SAM-dependent methyltransferase [Rossellomorea marisflavi]|uniref:16S rRNA methyltransferase n=1 Tax=Rossellomorea marisflavi TaxID=189381 RepID=A0A0J5XPC2_9BACI|nr:class I SAM-dependent methyltransferase [Rossellomorea marisflavi]KMK90923.1 16S rRNA methyltransferase [Rossellomorea marisflavi]KML26963.1 16S rRNA methyltransferase [Rossellomorea marisflavi]KZE48278.1 16S rRNA methyltransferase [Rossellomorea marisflavi]MCM2606564.1 class I SAM-dependent methyltransferase [Rossellomorea marisflavi]QHA34494.1 methyltransferase [Rossellomorea marisflavi]